MCQLLGMNCNVPTDICFSFSGFRQRGGATDVHADGWGIAFFEGRGVRVFLDPEPSAVSPIAELVRNYPIRSLNVIAHIRKGTQGSVSLENTHPFVRELWGRYWVFAHNGNLPGDNEKTTDFIPVGSTDSEKIFCQLLQGLRDRFDKAPSNREIFAAIHEMTLPVSSRGIFNFLLSNGDFLIAHSSTQLNYLVRQAPFGAAHLNDEDLTVDFSELTGAHDRVAVIATEPLTDNEPWIEMQPGSLWLFEKGEVIASCPTHPSPIKSMSEMAPSPSAPTKM